MGLFLPRWRPFNWRTTRFDDRTIVPSMPAARAARRTIVPAFGISLCQAWIRHDDIDGGTIEVGRPGTQEVPSVFNLSLLDRNSGSMICSKDHGQATGNTLRSRFVSRAAPRIGSYGKPLRSPLQAWILGLDCHPDDLQAGCVVLRASSAILYRVEPAEYRHLSK